MHTFEQCDTLIILLRVEKDLMGVYIAAVEHLAR